MADTYWRNDLKETHKGEYVSMNNISYSPWTIDSLIGSGPFGEVYEISRTDFGHVYKSALKVIHVLHPDQKQYLIEEGLTEKEIEEYYEALTKSFANEIEQLYRFR